MKCPKCHNEIPDNSKFCNECGASLATNSSNQDSPVPMDKQVHKDLVKCPQCGEFNYSDAETCSRCGTALSGKALEEANKSRQKRQGILLAIAAVLAFVVIIAVIVSCDKNKQNDYPSTSSSQNVTRSWEAETTKKTTPTQKATERVAEKTTEKETEKPTTEKTTEKPTEKETDPPKEAVPREYSNALRSAEQYNKISPMSKAGLFEQLTSEYGEKYSEEAAQYAIDNLNADWKENACKTAEKYLEIMPMSKDELYDQLISEYGEQYTPEEAQYAVDKVY